MPGRRILISPQGGGRAAGIGLGTILEALDRVIGAGSTGGVGVGSIFEGSDIVSGTGTASGGGSPGFTPATGYTISAPSGFVDGASITITGPSGAFGTKPGGAAPAFLWRPGKGYTTTTDPLSRATFTDANFPETGQSGPSGTPGLQSATFAPGSTQAFQTIFPGAAVITGTLTNGSAVITSVTQVSGTNFASVDYAFGGLVVKDLGTGLIPDGVTAASSQSGLGSNQITLTSTYTGTTTTGVTINISYGPDQIACPRALTSQTQNQIYAFRGMNNFPFRYADFNDQNNKFIRTFQNHSSTATDIYFQSNGSNTVISRYVSDGTSVSSTTETFPTNTWVWTANQWFEHIVMYHGNTSAGSADGGITYVAEGVVQIGALGSTPSQSANYWGGSSSNVGIWEWDDIACRPGSPLASDTAYTDYTFNEDSACLITIEGSGIMEPQWPTAWTTSGGGDSITFVLNSAWIAATQGSLAGLNLVVQNAGYTRSAVGAFESLAATPTFSPAAGTYSNGQLVTISSATSGATIYYTTDGSAPTYPATGTTQQYFGSVPVGVTGTTLKAIAVASGLSNSAVGSAAYTINSSATQTINFSSGFASTSNLWVGGSASKSGSTIILTPTAEHAVGTSFYETAQNVQAFSTQFSFQLSASGGTVQQTMGLAFVVQLDSSLAPNYFLASADSNLCGYGAYDEEGQTSITNSIGIKFDLGMQSQNIYPVGAVPSSTGLFVNGGGNAGWLVPCNDMLPYGINLYNGNVFNVNIVYDGALLTMVIKDATTGAQCRQVWPVNIPAATGSNTAFVGITGGAVEATVTQNLLNWSYSTGYNTRLASPTFSPAPGEYSSTQSVTISGPSGATIYYTTNGLLPTSSSTQYTGPISVSANEVIQAVAIESGFTDSLVASSGYQIGTANVINFPSGFASGNAITFAGSASLSGSALLLTDTNSRGFEAGAAWFATPVNVQTFSTTFTLKFTSANANGMTFCIQNQPPASETSVNYVSGTSNAVGNTQDGLGYSGGAGTDQLNLGILNSVAVAFDLYTVANSVGLYTDGAVPTGSQVATGLTFNGGTFNVTLSYDGTNLSISMQSTSGGTTFTHSWAINIPSTVSGDTAYVGFTGATGGLFANQAVNAWTFTEG